MIADELVEDLFERVRGDFERTRALRIALERFDDVNPWVHDEGFDEALISLVGASRALLRAFPERAS